MESRRAYYDRVARSGEYEAAWPWLCGTLGEDEATVRATLIDALAPEPYHRVLEIGCGTGHDSVEIARRLDARGRLVLQDFSPPMLDVTRAKLEADGPFACEIRVEHGDAMRLPYDSGTFDRVFHFGALNEFDDPGRALAEMARVCRIGGRVVAGDESLGPWLRETEYGRILTTGNPLYRHAVPIERLPQNVADVTVRWLLGQAFYVIAFRVTDGPPFLDPDLPIPGRRGGTLRTRHYGQLEGVRPETREAVLRAAERAGLSVADWLDKTLREAAT